MPAQVWVIINQVVAKKTITATTAIIIKPSAPGSGGIAVGSIKRIRLGDTIMITSAKPILKYSLLVFK